MPCSISHGTILSVWTYFTETKLYIFLKRVYFIVLFYKINMIERYLFYIILVQEKISFGNSVSLEKVQVQLEFFLNGTGLSFNSVISGNSGNLINHWSMNWTQFKDPATHTCLAGAMVASWSLTQEVAGLNPFNENYFLTLNSLNTVKTLRKNSNIHSW